MYILIFAFPCVVATSSCTYLNAMCIIRIHSCASTNTPIVRLYMLDATRYILKKVETAVYRPYTHCKTGQVNELRSEKFSLMDTIDRKMNWRTRTYQPMFCSSL